MHKKPHLQCLQIQWGWITPGTNESHRIQQGRDHLKALASAPIPATRHFLLVHCGWWLDGGVSSDVRTVFGHNPEPYRALFPASADYLRKLARFVKKGRLEFVVYPYAACVTEATSGEALLRSFRYSRDISTALFGKRPRIYKNHDAVYGLDWGTVQMPQILRLLEGEYLVAGKNGTVAAPDGTTAKIFGDIRVLYEIAKDPAALEHPQVFCMELHEHLELMREFQVGGDFISKSAQVEAVTLDEFLRRRKGAMPCYASTGIGSKSWYGGVMDSLLLEQDVKSAELRLPALEAFAAQTGSVRKSDDLWKRCMVLVDNHLLWQCHQYRPWFTRQAKALLHDIEKSERSLFAKPTGKKAALNPVPWKRDIVIAAKSGDILIRDVPGWGSKMTGRQVPPVKAGKASSPYELSAGDVRYRLGKAGEVEGFRGGNYRFSPRGWGSLLHLFDKPSRTEQSFFPGRSSIVHQGCLSLEMDIDLRNEKGYVATLEFGGIHGDAYLLRVERRNFAGEIFSTTWHTPHSLHWGGAGMPHREIHPAPIVLDIAYATSMRLTLWMASEDHVSMESAQLRFAKNAKVMPLRKWKAKLLTSVSSESPSHLRAKVIHESPLSKCVRFSGELGTARFELHAATSVASRRLEYHLRLHYTRPTDLGITSPPFAPGEGSLFGAECERPYIPGIAVNFPLPMSATYHVDKPFYIQQALNHPVSTWHTDRRDWWMGMSPFIGMNMASASWKGDSMALLTRGVKHFFRWRRGNSESLALSLGATLIHPSTQGFSVPKNSPLYAVVGRKNHDPYHATPFHKARGTYDFHYAVHPGLGKNNARQRFDFWRSAQEFALPASMVRTDAGLPGIASSNPAVIPTALETYRGKLRLRVVNMSGKKQMSALHLPLRSGSVNSKITLSPWAVREIALKEK